MIGKFGGCSKDNFVDKTNNIKIDIYTPKYNANLMENRNPLSNETYISWDRCEHLYFNKYVLYMSITKNDLLYLTTNIRVVYISDIRYNTSYKVDFVNHNTLYYMLSTLVNNDRIIYSDIIEVHRPS